MCRVSLTSLEKSGSECFCCTDVSYTFHFYCVIADLNGRFRGGILDIVSELARFIPARMISDKEDTINIDHIVKTYSHCLPAPVDEFILRGEVDLWRQKWVRTQAMNPDEAVPGTALEG